MYRLIFSLHFSYFLPELRILHSHFEPVEVTLFAENKALSEGISVQICFPYRKTQILVKPVCLNS